MHQRLRSLVITGLIAGSGFVAPAQALAQADKEADPCSRGYLSLEDGESERAVEQFEACLDTENLTSEDEVGIYAALGAAHLALDNFDAALQAYNFAFAIADTQDAEIVNPITYRNRGIAFAALEQIDRARPDLERAYSEMPDDSLTLLNLGYVYLQLDRADEAVVIYDGLVRAEPDWSGSWLNRSSALLDAGLTRAAVDDAARAVELEPESGTTLNMLCWTLIKDDRPDTALPICEQAVAAEPEIGAILHSHAAALEAVGRLDEALPLYARAYDLSPEDPEISADYERTHNP